jgi:hypothetical protein
MLFPIGSFLFIVILSPFDKLMALSTIEGEAKNLIYCHHEQKETLRFTQGDGVWIARVTVILRLGRRISAFTMSYQL